MNYTEMAEATGSGRIKNIALNLRKFGMIEGETSNMKDYHRRIIATGLKKINEAGVRTYCDKLGKEFGISPATIRSEYAHMKRYGLII